jgi:hypothetical protein
MSSAALAITTTSPRKARISGPVRAAIRLMVDEGRSRAEAAKACGITDDWLYRALERPECKSFRNHLMQVLRESEASRTIARAAKLADEAESEHVKLQANTWLAGLESIAPIQRTENMHVHQHVIPGLTINRGNWQPHGDVIDTTAHQVENARPINAIGKPAAHPEAQAPATTTSCVEQPNRGARKRK